MSDMLPFALRCDRGDA